MIRFLRIPYWSSSSYAGASSRAWYVDFNGGNSYTEDKSRSYYVRCVRVGPSTGPARRFSRTEPAAGQPIVADSATGLGWQGCAAGLEGRDCAAGSATSLNWQAALTYCENLSWGGQTDWRLPNATELTSIVDDSRTSPSINISAFPAMPFGSILHWSSSSYAVSLAALMVGFYDGNVGTDGKASPSYARCVRGGP